MSDYIKDMFIEVREKDETISPLTELQQVIDTVTKVVYGKALVQEREKKRHSIRKEHCREIHQQEMLQIRSTAVTGGSCFVTLIAALVSQGAALLPQLLLRCNGPS